MERIAADRLDPRVGEVLRTCRAAGWEAWVVGGAVRDLLLGGTPREWDLACSAPAQALADRFPRVIETGLQHGTVTVLQDGMPIEVTTFRGHDPGEVPSIHVDLLHRDFTVNALAWDPLEGRLLDPAGGLEDLRCRTLRGVVDPAARFDEDPLRPMRAARFAAKLGFRLERETRRAARTLAPRLAEVAVERIRHELERILLSDRPRYGIELLRRTDLLQHVVPELLEGLGMRQNRWHRYDVYHHVLRVTEAAPPRIEVRLAALLHDIDKPVTAAPSKRGGGDLSFYNHEVSGAARAKAIAERLRFSTRVIQRVERLVREHQFVYDESWSDAAVRRMLARVGLDHFDDLLALRRADILGRGRLVEEGLENVRALEERVRGLQQATLAIGMKDLAIGGREVMEVLGEGPSPRIGEAMRHLLDRVLEEPGCNTPDGLRALLEEWKGASG